MSIEDFNVLVATEEHTPFAQAICDLAKAIQTATFFLSLKMFKGAKLFGLTTGLAVMKINNELGYRPVTFSELTDDDQFWKGCESCVNYPILQSKQRRNCLSTAMLFDPAHDEVKVPRPAGFEEE